MAVHIERHSRRTVPELFLYVENRSTRLQHETPRRVTNGVEHPTTGIHLERFEQWTKRFLPEFIIGVGTHPAITEQQPRRILPIMLAGNELLNSPLKFWRHGDIRSRRSTLRCAEFPVESRVSDVNNFVLEIEIIQAQGQGFVDPHS